jgi:hypothetical protein
MRRCDDVFLEPGAVALSGETAFVEWTMGLKIEVVGFYWTNSGSVIVNSERDGSVGVSL